jgi:hypothetical protein
MINYQELLVLIIKIIHGMKKMHSEEKKIVPAENDFKMYFIFFFFFFSFSFVRINLNQQIWNIFNIYLNKKEMSKHNIL